MRQSQLVLEREDPSRSTSVTRVTAVGNVRQPRTDGEVTTLAPAVEGTAGKKMGGKKSAKSGAGDKRSLEEPEVYQSVVLVVSYSMLNHL